MLRCGAGRHLPAKPHVCLVTVVRSMWLPPNEQHLTLGRSIRMRRAEVTRADDQNNPKQIAAANSPPTEIKNTGAVPILDCPPELGTAAREEWHRIVAELTAK